MKPFLPLAALLSALALAGCGITAPPRDDAQWQSEVQGVTITWRATAPSALGDARHAGPAVGYASWMLAGQTCVVDLDMTLARHELTRVAAHEAGHCLQARHLLPGLPRPDLGAYFADPQEGYAETYARTYLAACGDSLRPLGWADTAAPSCTDAPDPRTITP